MSTVKNTSGKVPDKKSESSDCASEKIIENSTVDSGFISSGNLILSDEIVTDEEISADCEKSNDFQGSSEADLKEAPYMHLDSGVVLSESFSNLQLNPHVESGLNNLNDKNAQSVPAVVSSPIISKLHDLYQQDEDGDTPLHIAISNCFIAEAIKLIKCAPHPRFLDTPNDSSLTPLHLAVETGQAHIVRYLIVAGARPGPRDLHGDSPLHIACRIGDLDCLRAILNFVKPEERQKLHVNNYNREKYQPFNLEQWNYIGQTCVHVAAECGHIDILRNLIWFGADINSRDGCNGYSALHIAVKERNEQLLRFLLKECAQLDAGILTYGGLNALEISRTVPSKIEEILKSRGCSERRDFSEDESDDYDDDEDDDKDVFL